MGDTFFACSVLVTPHFRHGASERATPTGLRQGRYDNPRLQKHGLYTTLLNEQGYRADVIEAQLALFPVRKTPFGPHTIMPSTCRAPPKMMQNGRITSMNFQSHNILILLFIL